MAVLTQLIEVTASAPKNLNRRERTCSCFALLMFVAIITSAVLVNVKPWYTIHVDASGAISYTGATPSGVTYSFGLRQWWIKIDQSATGSSPLNSTCEAYNLLMSAAAAPFTWWNEPMCKTVTSDSSSVAITCECIYPPGQIIDNVGLQAWTTLIPVFPMCSWPPGSPITTSNLQEMPWIIVGNVSYVTTWVLIGLVSASAVCQLAACAAGQGKRRRASARAAGCAGLYLLLAMGALTTGFLFTMGASLWCNNTPWTAFSIATGGSAAAALSIASLLYVIFTCNSVPKDDVAPAPGYVMIQNTFEGAPIVGQVAPLLPPVARQQVNSGTQWRDERQPLMMAGVEPLHTPYAQYGYQYQTGAAAHDACIV